MKVQAEISLYPLRQSSLNKPIQRFIESLQANNLNVKTGAMSTFVTGDSLIFFQRLQKAFEETAKQYGVVLTVKISNVCPEMSSNK